MIIINNLSFSYNYYDLTNNIINNFSYTFTTDGIYQITGKNGVGKTTLLKLISGIFMPNSGEITFNINKDISLLTTKNNIKNFLTVYENIYFFADKVISKFKIFRLLKSAGLLDFYDKKPDQLSTGQQRKLAICCALINQKKVYLFDEPLLSLDDESIAWFENRIYNLSKDSIIIIISHQKLSLDNITTIELNRS